VFWHSVKYLTQQGICGTHGNDKQNSITYWVKKLKYGKAKFKPISFPLIICSTPFKNKPTSRHRLFSMANHDPLFAEF
jgi:hypothetical protein